MYHYNARDEWEEFGTQCEANSHTRQEPEGEMLAIMQILRMATSVSNPSPFFYLCCYITQEYSTQIEDHVNRKYYGNAQVLEWQKSHSTYSVAFMFLPWNEW